MKPFKTTYKACLITDLEQTNRTLSLFKHNFFFFFGKGGRGEVTSAEGSSSQFSTKLSRIYGASCMSCEYSPSIQIRAAFAFGSWIFLLLILPTTAMQSWLHCGYFLKRSLTSTCQKNSKCSYITKQVKKKITLFNYCCCFCDTN